MIDRRKVSDVLWLALQYAIQDRQTFMDAYDNDQDHPAVKDAQADIRAFIRLRQKLFGDARSQLNAELAKLEPVDFVEALKRLRDQPLDEVIK